MTDRTIPYEPDHPCEECGRMGAYDLMGDYLCAECAYEITMGDDDDWPIDVYAEV